ncbi:Heat shock transcription factor [Quillaja saponaria]|uniref:Heat shock transcription factor n=1 Tax=Quillaja saponaria TaxID=32244 RepID=A0AAD7P5R5_QUISA|nr:Heat shock transcription factor [Quillaja saponaria]
MVRKSPSIGSSLLPPFLKKCYKMVDDEETNSIISWSQNSNSFVILDMAEFTLRLLPKYFKHNNLSSFIRQLNYYGFRKVDTDRWEYSNNGFIRGLMKEVKSLKADRKALTQELVKLSQQQESTENRLLLLSDRLQGMEKNQQQMLSFLVMAIQSPDILAQLFQPKERNWLLAEAGIIKEQGNPGDGPVFSDGVIVSDDFLKLLMDENLSPPDNHSPLILPDLPDDGTMEKLLLDCQSLLEK